MNQPSRRDTRAFTLVEVLIALVVLAVLGFTVSARVGEVASQTFSIERRTVAHWVASNHIHRLRISQRGGTSPLDAGRDRERVTLAGREWALDINVQDTSQATFKRIEVDVFEIQEGEEIGPLEHMTAFIGQF